MRDEALVALLERAILALASRRAETASGAAPAGPEGPSVPRVELESFSSAPWASATFEGLRHQFTLLVSGEENAVDKISARLEADFAAEEFRIGDALLADVERTETDKMVDGEGSAAARLHYEALSIRE